jgi:hypothetical protein
MTDQGEGFCTGCRDKTFGQSDSVASECRHKTMLAGMKFCLACALFYKICRSCGAYHKGQGGS